MPGRCPTALICPVGRRFRTNMQGAEGARYQMQTTVSAELFRETNNPSVGLKATCNDLASDLASDDGVNNGAMKDGVLSGEGHVSFGVTYDSETFGATHLGSLEVHDSESQTIEVPLRDPDVASLAVDADLGTREPAEVEVQGHQGALEDDERVCSRVDRLGDHVDTDDEEILTMDCSSIIPEAAMKCGILPMDSTEDDNLLPMSTEDAILQSPEVASDKQHQQHQQQQQLCFGCKRPITERYLLKVMDQFWHEDCLKCSCCDCRLGEVGSTLFTKANLLLCRRDYLRLFGATGCCSVCSKMIPAFEMVMKAKGNVYHLECFACQQCNHRFCIGDRYYLYDNKILCEFDYEERIVFARLSHGYNGLPSIKRQATSINGIPASCRSSNVNGC